MLDQLYELFMLGKGEIGIGQKGIHRRMRHLQALLKGLDLLVQMLIGTVLIQPFVEFTGEVTDCNGIASALSGVEALVQASQLVEVVWLKEGGRYRCRIAFENGKGFAHALPLTGVKASNASTAIRLTLD